MTEEKYEEIKKVTSEIDKVSFNIRTINRFLEEISEITCEVESKDSKSRLLGRYYITNQDGVKQLLKSELKMWEDKLTVLKEEFKKL